MVTKSTSFITIIWGQGITEEEAAEAEELVRNKFPHIDVTMVKGDQPVTTSFLVLNNNRKIAYLFGVMISSPRCF